MQEAGHQVHPVTLPGQGDGAMTATLDDQLAAVVAADARPDRVAKVALIDRFPWADGQPYADFLPTQGRFLHFPGWQSFAGPDSDDMDEDVRASMEAGAIPVPEGVTKAHVRGLSRVDRGR